MTCSASAPRRVPWQSTKTAEDAADSLAPTVTADTALPKPRIAETATATGGSGGPDRRWFIVAPLLLAVVALLAVTLPGITQTNRSYDPQTGTSDYHHSRSVYRLFVPSGIHLTLGSVSFLVMIAACLVTAVAAVRPARLGPFIMVLRWGSYVALPVGAAALVTLVHHDNHLILTSVHSSETYNDGSTYSYTYSPGAGLWLLYVTFIGLYGLFIWREVIAIRQRTK